MTYEVLWTPEALTTFEDRITYLKTIRTEKEIRNFKIEPKSIWKHYVKRHSSAKSLEDLKTFIWV